MSDHDRPQELIKPILIIGCNRSGTTLLFSNLSRHPETWSLYVESQEIFYRHYPIDPEMGDRITMPPTPAVAADVRGYFYRQAHNKERFRDTPLLRHLPGKLLQRPVGWLYKRRPLRLVEKTPANSLRIPFLASLFPDAKFIFLMRRGEDVISSLMEGWKNWSHLSRSDPWHFTKWHYLVPPGWREWVGRPLQEICAFQWLESNRTAWEDLERVRRGNFLFLRHEDVMEDPPRHYRTILDFCELSSSPAFDMEIRAIGRRVYTTGGSTPKKDKWRELHGAEIESVRGMLAPLHQRFYGSG